MFLSSQISLLYQVRVIEVIDIPRGEKVEYHNHRSDGSYGDDGIKQCYPGSYFHLLYLPTSFLLLYSHDVPHSHNRMNEFRLEIFIYLISQIVYVDIYHIGVGIEVLVPHISSSAAFCK